MAVTVLVAVVSGCGDDGGGDLEAFCASVEALRDQDPFADLEIASPEEMRAAFDQLSEGVERIADDAPPDVEVQADAYRASVDQLVDQLRGAGFDPSQVDALAYGRAVEEYQSAAVSVDNSARSLCP